VRHRRESATSRRSAWHPIAVVERHFSAWNGAEGYTAARKSGAFLRCDIAVANVTGSTKVTQIVRLDAKPESIAIDPAKAAVIVIDMQNDFGSKGGMFDRAGIDISGIQQAVGPTAKVLAAARRMGIKIVYLKMGYRSDLSDVGAPDAKNRLLHLQRLGVGQTSKGPDGKEYRVLIRDTWGTDIVTELKPQVEDIVMYKHRFSGFYQTDLDLELRKAGINQLMVTGCTTSICVDFS